MRTEIPSNPHHKERTWRDIVFEAARVLRMGGTDAIGVAAMAASYFRSMDKLMAQAIMEILNERYAWILSTPTSFPDVEISLRRVAPTGTRELRTPDATGVRRTFCRANCKTRNWPAAAHRGSKRYLFRRASAFFAGLGFGRLGDHQKCRGCDSHGNDRRRRSADTGQAKEVDHAASDYCAECNSQIGARDI
jgi:hypothetical protein